ncbi:MAG: AAA family ATPase [Candidatus Delongbacteria bacterium]|nr:AAA family ATPase [Candidatus Delongbacteria bacterium]
MKFYDREEELRILESLYSQSTEYGKLTVVTGRRRVGKTLLVRNFAEKKKHLYFFIAKKAENLLCGEFAEQIQEFTNQKIFGEIRSFAEIFEMLLIYAKNDRFVLVIDEFQEFFNINPSVYSEIQKLWDKYKFQTKLNVIFIGSVYSLMIKIFQDKKEPLFGRADRTLYIKPFKPKVIKEILSDNTAYSNENLFFHYLFTGGNPRYEEILVNNKRFSYDEIIDFILSQDSPFIKEGKNSLIEEFGKDYGIYFSIIELISQSKTSRSEIESILEKSVGGYLDKLEKEYDIIASVKPFGSKKNSRTTKYYIKDNFLKFWFRFIFKYSSSVEGGNFEYIKKVINRDISTYSGKILEKLFSDLITDTGEFGKVGNYWEKGNQNEIDIVAVNDIDKKMLFAEVKLNKSRFQPAKFKEKCSELIKLYQGYSFEYKCFDIGDIDKYL